MFPNLTLTNYFGNDWLAFCDTNSFDDAEGAQEMIEKDPTLLGMADSGNMNGLMISAMGGRLNTVALLVNRMDAKAQCTDGKTALMYAAKEGHDDVATLLLPTSDANAQDENGKNALMLAAENGHLVMVRLLLPHTTNLQAVDLEGCTALTAAAHHGNPHIIKLLLAHIDAKSQGLYGWTALHSAAQECHLKAMDLLIPHSDVNVADEDGQTILMKAVENAFKASRIHLDIVKRLTAHCDVDAQDHRGMTATIGAALLASCDDNSTSTKILAHLLPMSNLDLKDKDGKTVLMLAQEHCPANVVDMIEMALRVKQQKKAPKKSSTGTRQRAPKLFVIQAS